MDKMLKFYAKVFYVMGKVLSGELSCTKIGLVFFKFCRHFHRLLFGKELKVNGYTFRLPISCSPLFSIGIILPKSRRQIFICKFSKNVKSKLYNFENSKTRGQMV